MRLFLSFAPDPPPPPTIDFPPVGLPIDAAAPLLLVAGVLIIATITYFKKRRLKA